MRRTGTAIRPARRVPGHGACSSSSSQRVLGGGERPLHVGELARHAAHLDEVRGHGRRPDRQLELAAPEPQPRELAVEGLAPAAVGLLREPRARLAARRAPSPGRRRRRQRRRCRRPRRPAPPARLRASVREPPPACRGSRAGPPRPRPSSRRRPPTARRGTRRRTAPPARRRPPTAARRSSPAGAGRGTRPGSWPAPRRGTPRSPPGRRCRGGSSARRAAAGSTGRMPSSASSSRERSPPDSSRTSLNTSSPRNRNRAR